MTKLKTLVLLTSYQPASKYRQSPGQEEIDAFWHGYFLLWHPSLILQSAGLPRLATYHDFEQPVSDHVFVIPQTPHRYHSAEWVEDQQKAGSVFIDALPEWEQTLQPWIKANTGKPGIETDWIPFASLGMGYLILQAYCDAQDHVNPLDVEAFYSQVREAALAVEKDKQQHHLEQAAHLLQESREVVNPSQLYQAISLFLHREPESTSLEHWLKSDIAFTMVTNSEWLQKWAHHHCEQAGLLKEKLTNGQIDWWGNVAVEQPDALLPWSAVMANLQAGLCDCKKWTNQRLESHGRADFAASPAMPAMLQSFGLKRSLGFSYDQAVWPMASQSLVGWRGPDSTLLESCTRKPEPLDSSLTAFHLGYLFHECTTSEYVGWIHLGGLFTTDTIPLWLQCWSTLHKLAPVFGQFSHLENTIRDIPATEQFTPPAADDFQSDYLLERTGQTENSHKQTNPISVFSKATVRWRHWEVVQTLIGLSASISTKQNDDVPERDSVSTQKLLTNSTDQDESLNHALRTASEKIAKKVEGNSNSTGYLVINPCSFIRNVTVHLPEATTLLPAPALASQKAAKGIDAVIEVPAMGIAWVPRAVAKGELVRLPKNTVVQGTTLRNTHIIVEVDPATGGLRSLLDAARNIPRLGQQLVYAPGSQMVCDSVREVRNGLAVGEIRCTGKLVDAHHNTLAEFQQSYRLAAGQRFVELDIQLTPTTELVGYPWHAYFASRWAWRDPAARLYKSVHHTKLFSQQTRPETPGFIELETQQGRTAIFSGGLPFWQRHSSRMLDTLLVVEGETETQFRFALSVDDDLPHRTAQDWLTPAIVVPNQKQPASSTTGWLFHLDAPSVLILDISREPFKEKSILVRLVESFGYATDAVLLCPSPPKSAAVVNSWGDVMHTITPQQDSVPLRLGCYEFQQVRLDF
ncbi:MAG: hypothetical protein JNJ77_18305 [Planctomycetia bacterium]|nr:hypothetical protein [Planctomycetia bacterium]